MMVYIISHSEKSILGSIKAAPGWAAANAREKTIAQSQMMNQACKRVFISQIHIITINKNGSKTCEVRVWDPIAERFYHERTYRSIPEEDLKRIAQYENERGAGRFR